MNVKYVISVDFFSSSCTLFFLTILAVVLWQVVLQFSVCTYHFIQEQPNWQKQKSACSISQPTTLFNLSMINIRAKAKRDSTPCNDAFFLKYNCGVNRGVSNICGFPWKKARFFRLCTEIKIHSNKTFTWSKNVHVLWHVTKWIQYKILIYSKHHQKYAISALSRYTAFILSAIQTTNWLFVFYPQLTQV